MGLIPFAIAFFGTVWMYLNPSAPMHGFFHPAHYTQGIILGQVAWGICISVICIWIDKKIN